MYTRAIDQQEDGYPRFESSCWITGYYIASLIPVELASFAKVTQIIQTSTPDSATTMSAFASVIVAAIASLAF
jgi:hypothetical protein